MDRIVAGLLAALAGTAPAAAFDRARLASEAPMRACPGYGAGFVKIPGTATCLRLSGRVSAGTDVGRAARAPATSATLGRLSIDTRTQSDLGPVRTFVRIDAGSR